MTENLATPIQQASTIEYGSLEQELAEELTKAFEEQQTAQQTSTPDSPSSIPPEESSSPKKNELAQQLDQLSVLIKKNKSRIAILGLGLIAAGEAACILAYSFIPGLPSAVDNIADRVLRGLRETRPSQTLAPTGDPTATATAPPILTPEEQHSPMPTRTSVPTPTLTFERPTATEPPVPGHFFFDQAPPEHDDDAEAIGLSTFIIFLLDNGESHAMRNRNDLTMNFPEGTHPLIAINDRGGRRLYTILDPRINSGSVTISKEKEGGPINLVFNDQFANVFQAYTWLNANDKDFPFPEEYQGWYDEVTKLINARSLELPEAQTDAGIPVIDTNQ